MRKTILTLFCLIASTTFAAGTSHWTHTSEADFKAGKFHNVVATNLGDLKLSRGVKTILGENNHVSAVHALVQAADGTIYAGTGPEGVLLAVKNDKAEKIADLGENLNIFSLLIDSKGRLLIGTGGDKGQIYRIDKPGDKASDKPDEKPHEIFSHDGVQYIWAMTQTPDGKIYAATGPEGQLFEIGEDGKSSVLFDSDQNNLVSMASDGKDLLYVGTDPDGLVYRINRKAKDVFVMFDAPEAEISALLLTKDGTLYAGTAAVNETPEEPEEAGNNEQVGRPEGTTGGVPIPTQSPEPPKPPAPTPPNPGEPAPIPKTPRATPSNTSANSPKSMMILPEDPESPPDAGDNGDQAPAPAKNSPTTAAAAANALATKAAQNPAAATTPQGNAIYRIDKDGFVTEVFRQQAIIYSLIEQNGSLLVGTGSEGLVYQVNPAAEETVVLAKVDPKEVISLLATNNGRVVMGLANSGDIAVMTSGFAADGTFTSPVLDATQISRFGKLQLHGTLPALTKLTVATRSSNVGADSDRGWSKWTDEQPASEFMQITSPTARYLQYRLSFLSKDVAETPVVDDVDVAYQVPNLAPQIKSVKITAKTDTTDVTSPTQPKPPVDNHLQTITWEASDPNTDALQYSLYFRSDSHSPWILMKDKLTEMTYDWDTRSAADGRYEIKVIASDEAANPRGQGKTASRVSDPVVVDNTAPVIGDIKALGRTSDKGGVAHVELRAVDRTGTIASLDYSVDSSTDWQAVLPSDNIADSPEETYRFDTAPLASGSHQVTVRVADDHGNVAHESVTITIEAPTASK